MKKLLITLIIITIVLFGSSCKTDPSLEVPINAVPYSDVRGFKETVIFQPHQYIKDDIPTLTFNEKTIFVNNETYAAGIMDGGKNPGLGIRQIHNENITGQGVTVAIIDQKLILDHPEYQDSIVKYHELGEKHPYGSMHGAGVASLLVGKSIGTAPGAMLYYVSVPGGSFDSKYYADALIWIVEQNHLLPEHDKIRAVSISAAPSGPGSSFTSNQELYNDAVALAQSENILVLDCRDNEQTGIIFPGYYDPDHPEEIEKCSYGFPNLQYSQYATTVHLCVPCSYRTVAEEYSPNTPSYQYTGLGGLSWGIPYAVGVLALGWQINPGLDETAILTLLLETAYIHEEGYRTINPPAFIDAVQETLR